MSERISTGLIDSAKTEIFIGDIIRMDATINNELHGDYVLYEVKQRGLTPIISYLASEKGQVLPVDYTGMVLSINYDSKLFLWTTNLMDLTPDEKMLVIPGYKNTVNTALDNEV